MRNTIIRTVGLICLLVMMALSSVAQQTQPNLQRSLAQFNNTEVNYIMDQSGKAFANLQQVIKLNLEKASIEQALIEIASKAGLKLMYSKTSLPVDKQITIHQSAITVNDALWNVLKSTNLRLALSQNRQLVLLEMQINDTKPVLEVVEGQVTDAITRETLPGVNILVKGTNTGTSTNAEGRFELTVPSLNDTLIFSFIGYQSQEIPINGRTSIDVILESQYMTGEELVVTAFGLKREQKSLTYSTQDVNTEQLSEARELNVVTSLTGKVAGLAINQAGTGVGSSSRVILRGNRSITGSSQPLYVVDGVPVRGGLSNLNPDNIESINVLKGPNAAALYGSAAQNGAIVVNTKRGEAGVVSVSLNNNFMFRDPIILTEYQNEYGQGSGGVYNRTSTYSWGPRMDGQMVQHWSPNPDLASTQIPYSPQPDNVRDQFQRGYNASTNLMASVGGETTQTLFSYSFSNAEGMVPNNTLQRHNVGVRINSQLADNLSLDSKLSYMQQNIDYRLNTGEGVFSPTQHMFRTPRNIRTEDMSNYEYIDVNENLRHNTWSPGSTRGFNGYWVVNNIHDRVPSERVMGLASLTYDFTDFISLMVRASYDGGNNTLERKVHNDTGTTYSGGLYSISQNKSLEWNGDFLLSYVRDLTENWNIDANFGGNIKQRRNSNQNSNTGDALTVPNFFAISNSQNYETSYNPGSPVDLYSLYSFAQVGWKNSIFLDITGRVDQSSTLPEDSRTYFYPSVGLSAVLSDLIPAFPDVFSFTRVRTSWAKVGNSAPPFMTQRVANFIPGGNSGFLALSTTLPNSNLKPEETESYELGLDVRFFEGRFGLDVTAYQTNTRNQLFSVALPPGSGASSFFTNGGDVENKGIEVLLSSTPVQTADFSWDMNVNFSANRNMVVKISDERPSLSLTGFSFLRQFIIEEDKPFGQVYSRGFERDDQGRVLVDGNGMPQVTSGQTVPVANFNPDWTGGISSLISFKNISISFLIDHRQGGTIVSQTNSLLDADGLTKRTLQGREGGLIFGDNFFADEIAIMASDGSPNTTPIDPETFWRGVGGRNAPVGEAFVVDATNTRLREMTIGYNFSASQLQSLPVSNLRISLVGRNLFFIHRASENIDPDLMVGTGTTAEGLESFAPPTARTFGANIKINF